MTLKDKKSEAYVDPDVPTTYVNESGDPNQMGRSQEEENENNTDIDKNQENKAESDNLDILSDHVNEDIDKSVRVSGSSNEDVIT